MQTYIEQSNYNFTLDEFIKVDNKTYVNYLKTQILDNNINFVNVQKNGYTLLGYDKNNKVYSIKCENGTYIRETL